MQKNPSVTLPRLPLNTLDIISAEGVHTDPAKIEAIQEWLVPMTLEKLWLFFCLAWFSNLFV